MKLWKDTRGTTMVEVMVAFVVLMMVMGIFSQALSLTGRMMNRADERMQENHQLAGDYYLENDGVVLERQTDTELLFQTSNGSSFTVGGTIREYSKGDGKIYDVIPRESKSAP